MRPNNIKKSASTAPLFVMLAMGTAHALDTHPYKRVGVIDCALPGTNITFALNGSGGAEITSIKSNYAPFSKAGRVKTWSAEIANRDGVKTLILDNLKATRIMVRFPNGNGMAFSGSDGVSDIVCQILVRPD
jgi:hypothetical protein